MSSTEKATVSSLGKYILGWMLCNPNGGTPNAVTERLEPLLRQRGSKNEQLALINAEFNTLMASGFVESARKHSGILTPVGRRTVLSALHWDRLPAKADWRVVQKRFAACALEMSAELPERRDIEVSTVEGEKTAVTLARMFPLDLGPTPTLSRVIDALAWHALGVKTDEPFTAQAAIRVLLNRLAGTRTQLPIDQVIEQLITQGPASEASAPKALNGAAQPPTRPAPAPLPEDDAAFAARVLATARALKTNRFGGDKVFISHILQRLTEEGAAVSNTEAIKARLVSAHRQGLLSMSRADLVEAMDPKDVAASETRHLSATFHFVRI